MRLTRFLFFLMLLSTAAKAQVGNEWVTFGQTYYKVPVAKDGIYKLTKADLAQAGVPVDAIDPRRIQLYHRGIEQAINFQNAQFPPDAIFDAAEFLEFYGKRNDGTLDAELYKTSSNQLNAAYNLYNDTAYYFLTIHPTSQGKRITNFTQLNPDGLVAESSHTSEQGVVYSSSYATGETFNGAVQLTTFGKGEGWSGPVLRENTSTDVAITGLSNGFVSGAVPNLSLKLVGRGFTSHRVEVYVGQSTASLRLLNTTDFFGYESILIEQPLAWNDIGSGGAMTVRVRIVGAGTADFVSIVNATVKYLRNFSMAGEYERVFTLAENAIGKSYIQISSPPIGGRVFDITDSNNLIQITTTLNTTLNAVVNETQISRKLFVTNQTITPSNIKRVLFRSFQNAAANYLIISNKAFQKPALGNANPIKAYAAYRASANGGAYDTLTVTIDQLYNQFTYGESTPLAIFRFLKYLEVRKRPDYLFIIGKGLDVSSKYYRNPSAFPEFKDFVPSAGYPASDLYYSVGLSDPDSNEPGIPTGRLSVTRAEQVIQYLNKIIEQEATPYTELWRKRILHLSGGIAEGEPATFKGYMEDFASFAEGAYLGGSVTAIAKRSLQAQELINISKEVNNGLGLITFFGHSSTTTTDFDIGFVTDPILGYNNKGKYPMLLINGCNAGAFFGNYTLFGEDWVNAADKGAVGFIAHSSFGLIQTLKRYSDIFYQVAYSDSTFLKQGIGNVQKEVARRYLQNSFISPQNISQIQQMVLLGDPAAKLFGAPKPDYQIDASSITVTAPFGKVLDASSTSIEVKIVVKNYGRAENENNVIRILRTLPDNTMVQIDSVVQSAFYQDTVIVTLPNDITFAGNNQLEIRIDADNEIKELREDNNSVITNLFIPFNGAKNLFPQNFALLNARQQTLVFQSANLLDSLRYFDIEIDTTYLFSSDWKKTATIKAEVLSKYEVTLLENDSLTYYWRTRLKYPSTDENASWQVSSFTYIVNGNDGWGQMSFPQYLDNATTDLLLEPTRQKINFDEKTIPVLIRTFGDLNTSPVTDVSVKIDGAEYNLATQGQPCRDNTINLLAFNRINTVPYPAIPFNFQDPRTCGREPQVIVSFQSNEVFANGVNDLIQAINDVAIGDSIILFSIGNPSMSSWNAAVIAKLSEVGITATQMTSIADGEPFVFYGKKETSNVNALLIKSTLSPANEQALVVNRQITGRKASGAMLVTEIGPAASWGTFKININTDANDIAVFSIDGIQQNGDIVRLFDNLTSNTDLSSIDATIYPYLRISYVVADDVTLTPAQLNFWLVEYETLPEGLLIFKGNMNTKQLQEGEEWSDVFGFVNISNKTFNNDLEVVYTSITKITNEAEEKIRVIEAPLPGDTTEFYLTFETIDKIGTNDVRVSVNPTLVPEIYRDNNLLTLQDAFSVELDLRSPVLSVLVDGRLLENDDYVSSSPEIAIRIWDENKLLLKTDTLGIRILLQYPCISNCTPTRIYFDRPDVRWQPATLESPFTAFFKPELLEPGNYTLQVFATDSRGNESGDAPYSIQFLVTDDRDVIISKPYPNPSTNAITFKIDIKGGEVPNGGLIEIFTPLGKQVFSADLAEHNWHVGSNQLYIAYNAQLGSGLHVYRITLSNGSVQQGQFVVSK